MGSFLKSLSNLVTQTRKYTDGLHVKMPSSYFSGLISGETEEVYGLGELVTSIQDTAKNIVQLANTAWCVGNLLNLSNGMAIAVLDQMVASVTSVMANMADTIISAIEGQIEAAIKNTIGPIFSLIEAVLTLLDELAGLLVTLEKIISSLGNLGKLKWSDLLSEEECAYMLASIAACFLNKFLGPWVDKITNKAVSEINKFGSEVNQKIREEFEDTTIATNYLNQESKMLRKASYQLQGLELENLTR